MSSHPGEHRHDVAARELLGWFPIPGDPNSSADWIRDLVEHSHDLLCVHDLQGKLLSINPAPARLLGYTAEEMLKIPMRDLIPPDFRPQFDEYLKRIANQGEDRGLLAVMTRTGERRIWEYHNTLRTEGVASPVVRGIAHDVTERMQAEKALRDSNKKLVEIAREQERMLRELGLFRTLLDQSNDCIEVIDLATMRILDVNEKCCAELGYTREELLAITVFDINPRVTAALVAQVNENLRKSGCMTFETEHRRKDGTTFPVEVNIKRVQLDKEYVVALSRDITERRRAEEALHRREAELREAQRVAHMGSWRLDLRTEVLTWSGQLYRELGLDPQALPLAFDGLRGLLKPEGWTRAQAAVERIRRTGRPEEIETGFHRADGSTGCALVRGEADCDASGIVTGLHGIAIDITERKRAEAALRESEAELREAQRVARMGGWRVDIAKQEVTWSGELYRMIGQDGAHNTFPFQELQGFLTEDSWRVLKKAYRQVLDTRQPGHGVEVEFRRLDGTTGWVILRGAVDYDDAGKVIGMHGGALDITERKRAEEELQASQILIAQAQDAAHLGCFNWDMLHNRIVWSPEQEKLYGLTPGTFPGRYEDWRAMVFPEDRERAEATIAANRGGGEAATEFRILHQGTGEIRWVAAKGRIFADSDGKPSRMIGINMDITERKRVEEALREAKEKLTEEKLYLEHTIDTEMGFEEIVGISKGLKAVMEQVNKVAASDATVLLLGETGTGKELVARAIHRLSLRHGNSFIKLNCAAIPSGLLESELFGAEKGAFTGAVSRKIGRLELADEGTIFLDEIGEISLALQPKLLRALQDREFERLGGTKTLKVNFRLIAATNRDLAESVRLNEFRRDLYYRLNVFPIRVPPLRERRDDIALLVKHFVHKCAQRMSKSITSVPKKTIEALIRWPWPGNVRELENFIERSVILTHGSVLAAPLSELQAEVVTESIKDETLESAERLHILRALRESHGRVGGSAGAAARLGLKRTTLQSKLKQMGIDPRKLPAAG